jgi:hypothetical protein
MAELKRTRVEKEGEYGGYGYPSLLLIIALHVEAGAESIRLSVPVHLYFYSLKKNILS